MSSPTTSNIPLEVTKPITLKDFFEGKPLDSAVEPEVQNATLIPRKIEIPRIQRSYAQGRETASEKRRRFLKSIYDDMAAGKTMTLDFVYGKILDNTLIPLDGQQRLTTLYLLHWYASRHADAAARSHVMFNPEQFNYMTRYSSRDFLIKLTNFQPDLTDGHMALSKQITEVEGWFAVEWRKDPTIASILVMLDAIDDKFADIAADLWSRLDKINFYLLDVRSMNLTDDVYVRMNSRGRELTTFEHFKAELLKSIHTAGIDEEIENRISLKFDVDWTEMLWKYRDAETNLVDSAFLRMFRFICMLITYRDLGATFTTKGDELSLVREYFSVEDLQDSAQLAFVKKNVLLLEKIFDIWANIKNIDAFFKDYIQTTDEGHVPGKVLDCWHSERRLRDVAARWHNPLKSWLHSSGNAYRLFTVLYIFTVVLEKSPSILDTEYFRRRLRIMSNMIKNTSDREIADNPTSDSGNRMPAILRQIDEVMLLPSFNLLPASLNQVAMEEELEKWRYNSDCQSLSAAEEIFKLEDHPLLDGMIGVVDFTRPDRFAIFHSLFNRDICTREKLEQAFLVQGDYTINANWGYRRMVAAGGYSDKVWYDFLRNLYKDFRGNDVNKQSRVIFQDFLDRFLPQASQTITPVDASLDQIIADYLAECEANNSYGWRYYYLKYPPFRRDRFGLITLDYAEPYASFMTHNTQKQWSNNSQQPFLKTILGTHKYQKADDFQRLKRQYLSSLMLGELTGSEGVWITCANDAWELYDSDTATFPCFKLPVQANPDGTDAVDRIKLLLNASADDFIHC